MPNVGRPSKGCANCRARKVKCDLKRPSCSQCIRAGKDCHGYRDPLSMMFKNESDVVAKKAKKRYEVLAKQKPPPKTAYPITPDPETPDSSSWAEDWGLVNPKHMNLFTRNSTPESLMSFTPSIEDQAQAFFIANYVTKPVLVPRGQFEWVTELLAQPDVDETFLSSVKAATLAGFANATKNPRIMQQAQASYGKALRLTNTALRNPESAIKDSTLVAVIMLGMYENFVMQDGRSFQAWRNHIDGACTLFKVRGYDQFKSDLARRIFHQFYGLALLIALETGSPVHEGMRELYDAMTPRSDYSVHGRAYTTRMINVLHDAIMINHDKNSTPENRVWTALRLDSELDEIKTLMPTVWHFDTIHLEQPSEHFYGDTYYLYLDPWIAQMWNNLNVCRLYLYKLLFQSLETGQKCKPPLFSEPKYESIKAIAIEANANATKAVIASVPQIVGMVPFPDAPAAQRRASDVSLDAEPVVTPGLFPPGTYLSPSQSSHMVHLIWPLYTAGQSAATTPAMRQGIISTLHYIALRIGTRQAIVVADELKKLQTDHFPPRILPHRPSPTIPYRDDLDLVQQI